MKGSVTEEMIADYKKEVMKPIEIGGKFHLYRPVEIPPLVKPTEIPYSHGGKKISDATYRRKMQDIIDDIRGFEADLDNAHFYKTRLEEQFRLGSSSTPMSSYDETGRTAFFSEMVNHTLEEFIKAEGLPLPKKRNKPTLVQTLVDHEKSKFKATVSTVSTLPDIKTELGEVDDKIKY